MLTASQYDRLIAEIMALYERYEDSVIVDIARRLGNGSVASASWQVQRLNQSAMLYDDILERLSALTGESERALRTVFARAGVRSMAFDDSVYKAAGLRPIPLNMDPAMAQVLAMNVQRTQETMRNLTLTTAQAGQEAFVAAADTAFLQVQTGTMSYQQAIRAAVKGVAEQGLSVISFAGRRDQLDVASRRAILTGVGQLANQLSMSRADELNQDLVQVSAHAGARTGKGIANHLGWQGKVYSRSGADPDYPSLVAVTGYGTAVGLAGINCRHSLFPYFKGISENAYDKATLDEFADRKVTYQGKEMPFYDATQQQRAIERRIRYWKRQKAAMEAASIDSTPETEAISYYQKKMREFISETGLVRQRSREGLVGV